MAIGIGSSSPHQVQHGIAPGGGGGPESEPSLGVRGVASVGSGLRTGVTVVRHAIRTGDELGEARHQAREAAARERLDHEAAEASTAALHEEHHRRLGAIAPDRSASEPAPPDSASPPAHGSAGDDATRQTIQAAVAAGEAGDTAPRGAYLDLSV